MNDLSYPLVERIGDGISIQNKFLFLLSEISTPIEIDIANFKSFMKSGEIDGLYKKRKVLLEIPNKSESYNEHNCLFPVFENGSLRVVETEEELLDDNLDIAAKNIDTENVRENERLQAQKINELEKQISLMKKEKKLYSAQESVELLKLPVNEKKILNAIRAEVISQKTNTPIIGRNKFRKIYRVNPRYFDDAIKVLISHNLISKEIVKYSPNIDTYKWKVLGSESTT